MNATAHDLQRHYQADSGWITDCFAKSGRGRLANLCFFRAPFKFGAVVIVSILIMFDMVAIASRSISSSLCRYFRVVSIEACFLLGKPLILALDTKSLCFCSKGFPLKRASLISAQCNLKYPGTVLLLIKSTFTV